MASVPSPRAKRLPRAAKNPKLGHVPIRSIHPSPENDRLYRPVDPSDPEIIALADSIRENGILEPLVVTADGFILSGHRRYTAAKLSGLQTVPVRRKQISRADDPDGFLRLLREHNRQREKSHDEKLREEIVSTNPDEAREALVQYRRAQAVVELPALNIVGHKRRAKISAAKAPFLAAVQAVLNDRRKFWPVSDRQIHYALLNNPPLRHASKPDSIYQNAPESYKSLVELLTRARLAALIPFSVIADETRPVVLWDVHADCRGFIRQELDGLLKGYWRNLQQSQPNHIEIIGEKNTVATILKPVAAEYCIPLTTGRGYCSLPPRQAMAERFRRSGKEKLVLLIVSDFDPDGEEIAHSFARSMRDDFEIDTIHAVKVALTGEQVARFNLPPVMQAKKSSAQCRKFVERHGENVFELEALPPADLQSILRQAIESAIDRGALDAEIEAEKQDAAFLDVVRRRALRAVGDLEETPNLAR